MKRSRRAVLAFGLLISLVVAASVHAAVEPVWNISFEKEINWQQLTPAGNLVVGTDEALYGIDPATGAITWQWEELKKLKQPFFEAIPYTQYAVVNAASGPFGAQSNTMLIDVLNGKQIWSSKEIGLVSTQGQFLLMETGQIMMFGQSAEKMKPTLVVADLETGVPAWSSQEFLKKGPKLFEQGHAKIVKRFTMVGNHEPVFDTGKTIITYLNKEGVRKHSIDTGELIWKSSAKLKDVSAPQHGYAYMTLSDDDKVLYVPNEKKLVAINTGDGSPVWKKPSEFKGLVSSIRRTEQGLLIRTALDGKGKGKKTITMIDPATGKQVWKKPFDKMKGATNYAIKDGKIVLYADGKLYGINMADGEAEKIVDKVKFKSDWPDQLEMKKDGYLLSATQELALYDFEGNEKFHVYHKAPGSSLLAKVASTAAVMAVNAMEAAAAHDQAMRTGRSQKYSLHSNPTLSKRFTATANMDNYMYMLTDIKTEGEKGPGLVKVNKNTGETDSHIILGTKEPEYELDEIEARLFFKSDKKEITCYGF